jgi:hypothetical protein
LEDPDTVATPLVNVIGVDVPKATAAPDELVTVGLNDPIEDEPEKVTLWEPV